MSKKETIHIDLGSVGTTMEGMQSFGFATKPSKKAVKSPKGMKAPKGYKAPVKGNVPDSKPKPKPKPLPNPPSFDKWLSSVGKGKFSGPKEAQATYTKEITNSGKFAKTPGPGYGSGGKTGDAGSGTGGGGKAGKPGSGTGKQQQKKP